MADRHGSGTTVSAPPQTTMGLLDYLTAHSLDEDYAYAARSESARPRRNRVLGTVVALTLFGALATVAGVQTARNADENAVSRDSLVQQINDRKAELAQRRTQAAALTREVSTLDNVLLQTTAAGRMMQGKLERLSVATGAVPVQGPGVRVTVDDAPNATTPQERVLDQDLQKLVNGLWQVGAEAVAVNGQRITSLTAIRHAGGAITVNFDSLRRPYVVSAIGNRDQMAARLLETAGGQTWLTLQSYGLQFQIDAEDSMKLPAEKKLGLRYAHTPESLR
jgi:uncharacterized protein YlxW (UPF0749 family)